MALMFVTLTRTDCARVTLPMEKVRAALVHNVSRSDLTWDAFKVRVNRCQTQLFHKCSDCFGCLTPGIF